MLHHILVKWKERPADPAPMYAAIHALFQETLAIPGVHKAELIPNIIDRPNRYDLLIRIDMDVDALPAYDDSEPHHRWKEDYGHLLDKKAIFDSEN